MLKVELICDRDCPNVSEARSQLMRAFSRLGLTPSWKEWDRNSDSSPSYVKGYGSPTILVEGKDCAGIGPTANANSCRIYDGSPDAKKGVPPLDALVSALQANGSAPNTSVVREKTRTRWLGAVAILPSIGVALLPKLACPACWPAYAGLLGAVGLGFLVNSKYLFALTAVFLLVAVGALGFRARGRRGYAPFFLGVVAAIGVMAGKFLFDSNAIMYGGISLLVIASLWNSWPHRVVGHGSCPSCAQTEPTTK